ncbi:(2Fe-2S) ferredoxin domain-containing protein [Zavarzinia compransoris]|uniref:(2Fe-2S) ferredoxin domain-containing protein n=1 Tax=Zavarzinia marina TaxID=2911065 RepID=UPI001F189CCB|nr:(2Fe-2S) ferredoxin domain-containing protein [Zavarzinia marina]MCF4166815.1 (2Fe-2S) ferredoxin domain-containing protein [Zavarzinia marina]
MNDQSIGARVLSNDPAPYFDVHVFACVNERAEGHPRGSCKARGAIPLRAYMKARADELGITGIRVNQSGCLDRCELGPVLVIYPEGIWYAPRSRDDIDEILNVHVMQGRRVTRLMLQPDQKLPAAE